MQDAVASLEVMFYQGSPIYDKQAENKKPLRLQYKFVVKKNKCGPVPLVQGAYEFWVVNRPPYEVGDVHDAHTIIKFLLENGLLIKEKSSYRLGEEKYKTQKELAVRLKDDRTFKYEITKKLIELGVV